MNEPLETQYLEWLYSHVGNVKTRDKSKTYWSLLRVIFETEFVWMVPNDDNRVEDGIELRYEFIEDEHLDDVDPDWMNQGCSMLEMLIALSRRLSFQSGASPKGWFWRLIENLDLEEWTDRNYNTFAEVQVQETLERVVFRTYHPDGRGGLFPLEQPGRDQREVEIWYQLNAYLLENE